MEGANMSRDKDFAELWEELGRNIYRRVEELVLELVVEKTQEQPQKIRQPQRTYTYEQLHEIHDIAKDKSLSAVRAEFYGEGNRSRKKLNAHPLIIDAAKKFGKTTDGIAQKIIRIWDFQA